MKRLSDDVVSKIKELRENGYRIKYICKELNVSKNTVVKYAKKINVSCDDSSSQQ